jgi:hypothetical protein
MGIEAALVLDIFTQAATCKMSQQIPEDASQASNAAHAIECFRKRTTTFF